MQLPLAEARGRAAISATGRRALSRSTTERTQGSSGLSFLSNTASSCAGGVGASSSSSVRRLTRADGHSADSGTRWSRSSSAGTPRTRGQSPGRSGSPCTCEPAGLDPQMRDGVRAGDEQLAGVVDHVHAAVGQDADGHSHPPGAAGPTPGIRDGRSR